MHVQKKYFNDLQQTLNIVLNYFVTILYTLIAKYLKCINNEENL